MAAFLNQDIQTLDLEEVSRIFQSEASIAGPSNVTEASKKFPGSCENFA